MHLDSQPPAGGTVRWRLLDPYGVSIDNGRLGDGADPFSAPVDGEYWLVVGGDAGNAADASVAYTFELDRVPDIRSSLVPGTTVNGNLTLAGQNAVYSFHLSAATQLAFDALTSRSDMFWSLTGPNGLEVDRRRFDQNLGAAISTLAAGDYTLTVDRKSTRLNSSHL